MIALLTGCNTDTNVKTINNNSNSSGAKDAAPIAKNIQILGTVIKGGELQVKYDYFDQNGDAQDVNQSSVDWYADNRLISSSNNVTLTNSESSKAIRVSIKPVALSGQNKNQSQETIKYVGSFHSEFPANEDQPPFVSNVVINGPVVEGQNVNVSYSYLDTDLDLEGDSIVSWLIDKEEVGIGTDFIIPLGSKGKILSALIKPVAMSGAHKLEGFPQEHIGGYIKTDLGSLPTQITDVSISGYVKVGEELTLNYTIIGGDNESKPVIKWLLDGVLIGTDKSVILPKSGLSKTLTIKIKPATPSNSNIFDAQEITYYGGVVKNADGTSTTPSNDSAPIVSSLFINGSIIEGAKVSAEYTYFDGNDDLEGMTEFQWFLDHDLVGIKKSFVIPKSSSGKALKLVVTAKAISGDNKDKSHAVTRHAGMIGLNDSESIPPAVIDSPPIVFGLVMDGKQYEEEKVSVNYHYFDVNGDRELDSQVSWQLNGETVGFGPSFIIPINTNGKVLSYKIKPIAATGDNKDTAGVYMYSGVSVLVNTPPQALTNKLITPSSKRVSHRLIAVDVDGDPLTFKIVKQPKFGIVNVLSDGGGDITYGSNIGFKGSDIFEYSVSDGKVTINKTVAVTVSSTPIQNKPPIGLTEIVSVLPDQESELNLSGYDENGDALHYFISLAPKNGKVISIDSNTGMFIYKPNSNWRGVDTLEYSVSDGKTVSNKTLSIKIIGTIENSKPIALSSNFTNIAETKMSHELLSYDDSPSLVTYSIVDGVNIGEITLVDNKTGVIEYTPPKNFEGKAVFKYMVNDGEYDDTAIVTIDVVAKDNTVPTVPQGGLQAISTYVDTPVTAELLSFDINDDKVSYGIEVSAKNGDLVLNSNLSGGFTYTPMSGFFGNDSFTYSMKDKDGKSTQLVDIKVLKTPKDEVPAIGTTNSIVVGANMTTNVFLTAYDFNNDDLVFVISAKPREGELIVLPSKDPKSGEVMISYTPTFNFVGSDVFSYKVLDGKSESSEKIVNVEVVSDSSANRPPIATLRELEIKKNTTSSKILTGYDTEGQDLTFSIVSQPKNSVIKLLDEHTGSITISHSGISTNDTFEYSVSDGVSSVTGAVNLTIKNSRPILINDIFKLTNNEEFKGKFEIRDPDGDPLYVTTHEMSHNGYFSVEGDGQFTYRPNQNYLGRDSVWINVSDGTVDERFIVTFVRVKVGNVIDIATNPSGTISLLFEDGEVFEFGMVGRSAQLFRILPEMAGGRITSMYMGNSSVAYVTENGQIVNYNKQYNYVSNILKEMGRSNDRLVELALSNPTQPVFDYYSMAQLQYANLMAVNNASIIDIDKLKLNTGSFFSNKQIAKTFFINNIETVILNTDGSLTIDTILETSGITDQFDGSNPVVMIFTNNRAIAALHKNGAVTTFGNKRYGGDSSAISTFLDGTVDIVDIKPTSSGFAFLNSKGAVMSNGEPDMSIVATELNGTVPIVRLYSHRYGFAALRSDNKVIFWGDNDFGFDASKVDGRKKIKEIQEVRGNLVFLFSDNTVYFYGEDGAGNDTWDSFNDTLDGTNKPISRIIVSNPDPLNSYVTVIFDDGTAKTILEQEQPELDAILSNGDELKQVYMTQDRILYLKKNGSLFNYSFSTNSVSRVFSDGLFVNEEVDKVAIQFGGDFVVLFKNGAVTAVGSNSRTSFQVLMMRDSLLGTSDQVNPYSDIDLDGLFNSDEQGCKLGVCFSISSVDSDNDGVIDGQEVINGTDPLTPELDHFKQDRNGDGYPDMWKFVHGNRINTPNYKMKK